MEPKSFPIARGSSAPLWFCGVLGLLMLALGGFIGSLSLFGPRLVTFEVSDKGLRIAGDLYGRTIPRSALEPAAARPLDRAAEPGFAPGWRTNGIGLPDYQSGWFRLANGSKALMFVTDWNRAVVVPTTEGYTLLASPADPQAFLAAVKQPAGAASTFAISAPSSSSGPPLKWLILLLSGAVPLAVAALLGYVAYSTRAVRFEVSEEGLRIRGDMFGRLIPRSSLRLAEARLVNLKEVTEQKPVLRTCGVGLPGYYSGWFRLKDRSKALLFLTDRSRAVDLPTTDGYDLLISPEDPEGFLAALCK